MFRCMLTASVITDDDACFFTTMLMKSRQIYDLFPFLYEGVRTDF